MAIVTNDEVFAFLGIATQTSQQTILMNLLRPMAEDAVRQEVGYSIEQATHTHFLPECDSNVGDVARLDSVNNRVYFESTDGTDRLYVPERPLRSVTYLYEDHSAYGGQGASDFPADTLLNAGTDYFIDYTASGVSWSGLIRKIAGTWPSRARTVKVVYVAGVTAGELAGTTSIRGPKGAGVSQLKQAALIAAAIAFKEPQTVEGANMGPISSERLADYAISYGKSSESLFGLRFKLPEKVLGLLSEFKRYDF